MKKILYILLFLPLFSVAQVKVIAPVEPNNTSDTYPTHRDIYGQGGLMTVTSWTERNAITADRRKLGMLVRVVGSGVDSTYTLVTDLTNASWIPYTTGATGSFVTTNTEQTITATKDFATAHFDSVRVGTAQIRTLSNFTDWRKYTPLYIGALAGNKSSNPAELGGGIAIGWKAYSSNLTGLSNVAIGLEAMRDHQTGNRNTVVGSYAFTSNVTGGDNTVLGAESYMNQTSGSFNTAFGSRAFMNNISGDGNTTFGHLALYQNTSGSDNTVIGRAAGNANLTGSGNVFIGLRAGYHELGSNKLYISSGENVDILKGDFSTGQLEIPTAPTTSAGSYAFLTRNSSTGLIEKVASSAVATDASVVHLAGTETVTGTKNFSSITATGASLTSGVNSLSLSPTSIFALNSSTTNNSGLSTSSIYISDGSGSQGQLKNDGLRVNDPSSNEGRVSSTAIYVDDATPGRLGFVKKSGVAPVLGHGSATTFKIARSSTTGIDPASSYTDVFTIDASGNLAIPTVPATSAGTYAILTRNVSTGVVEKVSSGSYEQALTFSSPLSRSTNTISIPAAASGVSGYVSTTAQTFSGAKTFADDLTASGKLDVLGNTVAHQTLAFTDNSVTGFTGTGMFKKSGALAIRTDGVSSSNTFGILNFDAITSSDKTYAFPNTSGTVALTNDAASGYVRIAGNENVTGEKTFTGFTYLTKLQTSTNAEDSILVHSDFDNVIKLAPANYVTLSGNQDVGGMKTFTNGITIEDADGMFFEASPNTSEGGYEFLTRNTSTGLVEKVPSSSVALDANTVHITGTESVTGIKTFTDARIIDNGSLRFNDGANNGFLQNATLAESVTWVLPDRDGELALKNDWFVRAISTKTANYTLTTDDHYILVDATSGNITITVPAASGTSGREWVIKRIDNSGNTVTIDPNASETIDGASTASISSQWSVLRFVSNGTNLFKTM